MTKGKLITAILVLGILINNIIYYIVHGNVFQFLPNPDIWTIFTVANIISISYLIFIYIVLYIIDNWNTKI